MWYPHLRRDIERVQKRATRLILVYVERLKKLKLPTLAHHRRRGDMIQTFKIIHGIEGVPSERFFTIVSNPTTHGHNFKLDKPVFPEALPGVLGNRGTKTIFQGNKGLKIKGTQAILGNREHRKSRFCFRGTRPFFRGEQGNRYPSSWVGLKPRCKTTFRLQHFSQRIINDWNALPSFVVNAKYMNDFKSKLDLHWNHEVMYQY